ncbi:MAG: Fe-S-binding domain-containing protein [Spirochaetae bacterium HGW-Spirochaetae-1]|jgi:Ni,Fe-hydrogenase III large subunit/Ni,Fe-hydrogenase III component G|nr:MAG: Fe-S-binding domain-containing protein [Spirochaetae bacterium HGW-Spirochaetae-1]
MKSETLQKDLKSKFGGVITGFETPKPDRLYIDVKKEGFKNVAYELWRDGARYLVGVGYDNISRDGSLGMIHCFAYDGEKLLVNLRTATPEKDPVFDSVTPEIPGAGWSEREYQDLLGMKFTGHPKPKKLVTADDWPDNIYPLRKDVPYDLVPPSAEDVAYQLDECPEGCSVIPVGPFHPSLHEPNHWAVYVDGETIKGADYRGFMTHRGIEKLCTTQVSYNEIPFIAERICGICGSVHATAYSQAVEEAVGLKISRRAEYIRTAMLEIERLHSHLLWLGVAGHLIGFDTVFMQSWRVREQIMWLCERITGNRKTYGMIIIGGVRRDLTPETQKEILDVLKKVEEETMVIFKAIKGDTAIHKRTKGVGFITREQAVKWSLVGPVARARGVDIDVRRDHPYAAYNDVKFDVPVVDSCDVWGTVVVRILEIFEAIKIIRQLFDQMPAGELITEVEEALPALKHGISNVEAPRGESVHYVITGEENRPDRWRVRAPTYPNLQGVPDMLTNDQFADFPIILGSIDPCFSCTDRVNIVNVRSGKIKVMNRLELENMSRNYKRGR